MLTANRPVLACRWINLQTCAVQPSLPTTAKATTPSAPTFTLPVNDTITLFGIQYTRTGSITYTPVTVTPPPPPPPPGAPTPSIYEFRDATRSFAVSTLPGDSTFWINGSNFGTATGSLTVDTRPLTILHWDDNWINATAPPFVAGARAGNWVLRRADATSAGGYDSFLGPAIVAPPSSPSAPAARKN